MREQCEGKACACAGAGLCQLASVRKMDDTTSGRKWQLTEGGPNKELANNKFFGHHRHVVEYWNGTIYECYCAY